MTSNHPSRDDRPDDPARQATGEHGTGDGPQSAHQADQSQRRPDVPWQGQGPDQTPAPGQGPNAQRGHASPPWQGQNAGSHGQSYGEQPRYGQYSQPDGGTPPQPEQPGRYGQYGQPGVGQPQPGQQPQYGQQAQPGQYGQQPQYGQYGQPGAGQPQYGQPGAGQPQYGQYGQPAAGQPQHGQYGQQPQYGQYGQPGSGVPQYSAPYGFGGAPQPGIIPLRPLNVGEILDGAFRSIRANPKVMFGLSLLVMGILTLIDAIAFRATLEQTLPLLSGAATPEALGAISAGSVLGYLFSSLAISIASVVLTGLLIISVSQSVIGRVVSAKELWEHAKGQAWRLIGLTLLLTLLSIALVAVVGVVIALLIAGVSASGSGAGAAVAGLVGFLLVLAALVVAAFFTVRLGIAAPALMLERTGIIPSIRRSWSLTSGNFWRIFGALALAAIIVTIITSVLTIPISVVTAFLGPQAVVASAIVTYVLSAVVSALTTPFFSAVLALVYVDVRMRKEGLDVELARAAEAG
ncbi:glycerophosphoryl diester phosphodiesterase membrane domain-containing protein [Georgenia sp. SYP-B2076]|uniref:glycerophosphoryl diester phosphodiesterase membrane domain-containing protein n=1 Tax=Georgenia sp. SYP-B2076 TaxID=2495881 RepID=UPI000F8D72E4|nr:glycerophosphoryl diester phosphodiesterase membrane domain-containing protein [Georgenia sp. SYP-B2076]